MEIDKILLVVTISTINILSGVSVLTIIIM